MEKTEKHKLTDIRQYRKTSEKNTEIQSPDLLA